MRMDDAGRVEGRAAKYPLHVYTHTRNSTHTLPLQVHPFLCSSLPPNSVGVEKHGEDWAAIAEFVGTKNPMQCCTRFLQMPIEEAILAEGMAANGQRGWVAIPEPGEEETTGAEAAALGPLPFADVSNPIMAQVGWLVGWLVGVLVLI